MRSYSPQLMQRGMSQRTQTPWVLLSGSHPAHPYFYKEKVCTLCGRRGDHTAANCPWLRRGL